jgi:hypothetical protein
MAQLLSKGDDFDVFLINGQGRIRKRAARNSKANFISKNKKRQEVNERKGN